MDQKNLETIVATLSANAQAEAEKAKNDALMRRYGQMFEKASAYMNLVVALGYGAFFATWSVTKTYLTQRQILTAGLCVLFSLFWFVAWQVFLMIVTTRDITRMEVLVKASVADFPKVEAAEDLRGAQRQYWLRRVWYVQLILTVIPGFTGGLVLIYAIVRRLLGV